MATARQHSPSTDLDDFWKEFKDIESSKQNDGEEEDLAKTPDEGEQEAAWLKEAGYGFLVSKMAEDGKELSEEEIHALTSPLSSHHAVAVRKRVDTLNATLRKKQKYTTKIDVRNIFPQQPSTHLDQTSSHQDHKTVLTLQGSVQTEEKHIPTRQGLTLPISNPFSPAMGFNHPSASLDAMTDVSLDKVPRECNKHPSWQYQGLKLDKVALKLQKNKNLGNRQGFNDRPKYNDLSLFAFSYDSTQTITSTCFCPDMTEKLLTRTLSDNQTVTSPCHSKSSSCDTLESLDSGLDSCSNLTGSRESLDAPAQTQSGPGLCQSTSDNGLESPKSMSSVRILSRSSYALISSSLTHKTALRSQCISPTQASKPSSPVDVPLQPPVNMPHPLGSPLGYVDDPVRPGSYPLDTEDESSPLLVWYRLRASPVEEAPRSPVSPRSDNSGPVDVSTNQRRSGKTREKSFLRRGGYSMTGQTEELNDHTKIGVEMLSVQSRQNHHQPDSESYKRNSQLSPISDTDILFDFNIEEETLSRSETKVSIKSLHNDDLPNYSLVQDPLGTSHINDVSPADLTYIRSVALLELTSLLDTHSISYTRRRSKKRHKEQGVFGVPLSTLIETDQKMKSNTKIPLVFTEIISYLLKNCIDCEGLLRVPGLVSRIQQLRQDMEDKFYQGTFTWGEDVTANDVAALMKLFLRELPSPLLTDEYIEAFAQVENLQDRKLQLHALNLLILLLPDVNRNTLAYLLEFLDEVVSHSNKNRMSLSNVAMIMAPNLFLAPKVRPLQAGKSKGNWDLQVTMATGTSNIVRMLIKYRKILWTIPSNILSHVRRQYELEQIRRNKDKSKRFYNKKDKTDVYKKPALISEADFQEGVIRIQAPTLTKSSTAIQLDDHMTAGDIVSKFKVIQGTHHWESRKGNEGHKTSIHNSAHHTNFTSAGDDTYLYEVGGNIGERCLPHYTNMLALYKVNPNAEWIIKQRIS